MKKPTPEPAPKRKMPPNLFTRWRKDIPPAPTGPEAEGGTVAPPADKPKVPPR